MEVPLMMEKILAQNYFIFLNPLPLICIFWWANVKGDNWSVMCLCVSVHVGSCQACMHMFVWCLFQTKWIPVSEYICTVCLMRMYWERSCVVMATMSWKDDFWPYVRKLPAGCGSKVLWSTLQNVIALPTLLSLFFRLLLLRLHTDATKLKARL